MRDGADAQHAGIDGAERTEATDDRRRRLEPHRRAVVELLERLLAAHDVMGAGALDGPAADPLDLRGVVGVESGPVPEAVVVVEVVAHG